MRLIVTVGMPGSGKDELVEVARQMGLATLKMGDLVREDTRRRGLPLTNANVGRVASEERDKHGGGVWAQRAIPKLIETKMLVDGCRSDSEVTVFRHHFGDLYVLGIYSSPEHRYDRMSQRGRGDDAAGLQEFYDRDRRELKWGIGNAFALADGMLVNEGGLDEFRKNARAKLQEILERDIERGRPTSMDVYLFRHGPAEERDPRRWSDDALRPLSRQGVVDTKKAAQGLAALEPKVEKVITSPAVRAYRTAEIVRDALGVSSPLVTWPELAPDESASSVLARLSNEPVRVRGVVLVGHEPTLGEFVGLAVAGEATSVARLSRGGVAALEFPRAAIPSGGRLEWLMTRRQLARVVG